MTDFEKKAQITFNRYNAIVEHNANVEIAKRDAKMNRQLNVMLGLLSSMLIAMIVVL